MQENYKHSIVELKAAENLAIENKTQLINYQKTTDLQFGLL